VFKHLFGLLVFGMALALGSASCGPTCPAGQQSCGTSNASGGSGDDAGTSDECALLKAIRSCMKSYCATASNPFCICYNRGYDIDSGSCKCVDLDTKRICDQYGSDDASSYDCAAASSGVSSICVPVN